MTKNKFQLFTEFLPIIFNSPLSVLKYLNSKNIKRLSIALKNEPIDQIVYNLKNLLEDGQVKNVVLEIKKKPTKKKYVKRSVLYEKEVFTIEKKKELQQFLASNDQLLFPVFEKPVVSILLLFYNRAELSYDCLKSIIENVKVAYELVIIDNASSDETEKLLNKIKGAQIKRNVENL